MMHRAPRVLDASAMVGYFKGNRRMKALLDYADQGIMNLLMPTTAIADAQAEIDGTFGSWHFLLFGPCVRSMPLAEHCAVDIGTWPGSLATRHVVHEAQTMQGIIVTTDRTRYKNYDVDLLVV